MFEQLPQPTPLLRVLNVDDPLSRGYVANSRPSTDVTSAELTWRQNHVAHEFSPQSRCFPSGCVNEPSSLYRRLANFRDTTLQGKE